MRWGHRAKQSLADMRSQAGAWERESDGMGEWEKPTDVMRTGGDDEQYPAADETDVCADEPV